MFGSRLFITILISVELVQDQAKDRHLLLVSGFVHDISTFLDDHPGGRSIMESMVGKDSTASFFGGVYDHSNAAHNVRCSLLYSCRDVLSANNISQLLATMRVGVLYGGVEHISEEAIPPWRRLEIVAQPRAHVE